jgi:C-terminal processing protease CtpA/Prc
LSSTSAIAASAETYRQLSLFGDVFEKVRTDYVEKPEEAKLIESAINGMLASLDPHSSYMDPKSFRDMQVQTSGQFGGLGIEVTMEEGLVKVVTPIDDTPAPRPDHVQRRHRPDRGGPGPGSDPEPGGRQDARPGQYARSGSSCSARARRSLSRSP